MNRDNSKFQEQARVSPILINAARIGQTGGLRSFTESLAKCVFDIVETTAVVPSGIRLDAAIQQQETPAWLASSSQVSVVRPILWWVYGLFFFPCTTDQKILSSTHHVLPLRKSQIVTVHDLRPFYYPDTWVQKFNFRFLLPRNLRRCEGVITVSEFSKRLLVEVYGLLPSKVHVVMPDVDADFFISQRVHPRPKENPFLLCVGSSWKHKNIDEVLRMHAYWEKRFSLKIIAGVGQYSRTLKRLSESLGINSRVEFLSDVTRSELRLLYNSCAALVYPSLMEGFGLPPLEAMASGSPVIVSDIPLFREVYGDIPIFVKLGEENSWRDAFVQLESLSESRIRSGISHARGYSLVRMREAVAEVLDQIWGVKQ